jgi:hypothetical protein
VGGGDVDALTIEPVDPAGRCPAQVQCLGRDGIEDRLDIGLEAADDPEDFAGGRLALERLGEVAVARLELPQRLHQALLEIADAGSSGLGFGVDLHGLCTAPHRLSLPPANWPSTG